jgi:hypothetical protein
MAQPPLTDHGPTTLREIAGLFLKLGLIAFGGPAAHIAMMRDELVTRRRWIGDAEFLDMLGATNLISGPNSTEMAIHIGRLRGGWRGLVLAGLCFILPAASIVLALAWLYVAYGTTPAAEWLLYTIDWWSVDGGGDRSSGGAYVLDGTIGQADASVLSGGAFTINGGYRAVALPRSSLHLPMIRNQ